MHGKLHANKAASPGLHGDDFELLQEPEAGSEYVVSVATDVPVHGSLSGVPASQQLLTPFIQLVSSIGNEAAYNLMQSVGRARGLRESAFAHIRRAANAYANGDSAGVVRAISAAVGAPAPPSQSVDAAELLRVAFVDMYGPIESAGGVGAAAAEAAAIVDAARQADAAGVTTLFHEMQAAGYLEHRRKLLDIATVVLEDVEALFPAMWVETMSGRVGLDHYRVMRDDFAALKIRYQDIFELGSRTVAFLARFANIARRDKVEHHSGGKTRSLEAALNKTSAFDREPWLVEFPDAKRLYDAVERHTRNDIGHALVRYDFEQGALLFEDGTVENYLEFLVDYLGAVRLTHYLVECMFLLDQG